MGQSLCKNQTDVLSSGQHSVELLELGGKGRSSGLEKEKSFRVRKSKFRKTRWSEIGQLRNRSPAKVGLLLGRRLPWSSPESRGQNVQIMKNEREQEQRRSRQPKHPRARSATWSQISQRMRKSSYTLPFPPLEKWFARWSASGSNAFNAICITLGSPSRDIH